MSTVVKRTFRSSPYRDAADTWQVIVDLLTLGQASSAKSELLAVGGVAASVIADQYPKDHPIVVTCDGPRTRIYCLYDEDAIDDSGASEGVLGFNPLAGEWAISLPCHTDDLSWVQGALKKHSNRITARSLGDVIEADTKSQSDSTELVLDVEGFLRS